ncbi:MAG: dTMP kinase [Christensenellaceae bacterium]|jgi:dTMP kinase|nr:dTMP kinase [Christensenellaceae bacterium]
MDGIFITLEGCEGVGKTTQVKLLQNYIEEHNIEAVFTREPGGTPVAEEIRKIILETGRDVVPLVEAYLFATARADHMQNLILPALRSGKMVICDRFIDSSLAYQGGARGLGFDVIYQINKAAIGGRMPDCTVFLDMNPIQSWRKQKGKVVSDDRLEGEADEFHTKVYQSFCKIRDSYTERYVSIIPQTEKLNTHSLIVNALKKRGYFN